MATVAGTVLANGDPASGSVGFDSELLGTGSYQITFDTPMPAKPDVVLTGLPNGYQGAVPENHITVNGFQAELTSGGQPANGRFSFEATVVKK
jgi:hypothetical protein